MLFGDTLKIVKTDKLNSEPFFPVIVYRCCRKSLVWTLWNADRLRSRDEKYFIANLSWSCRFRVNFYLLSSERFPQLHHD
jgi:hypothetical protein